MKEIVINSTKIHDWPSFHEIFKENFGFPEFYGANMDAWIDCMSYLDDPASEMNQIALEPGEPLTIKLLQTKDFIKRCPTQFVAFVESVSFVNQRFAKPLLYILFV
ncbi:MAG: barstar family protein [Ardenticatenaceae bacterium]|nr:barstar family protein [Anaerolineales bacterium]MCB8976070.1 barstar family protein [Ardenticatenaceae bacterium]